MTDTTLTSKDSGTWMRGTDYVLVTVIMGLMGAFLWAIRGTGGYGGETGGILAGLGWAALWLLFSRFGGAARQRPYGSGWLMAAITFGIAVGGFTGYGVYIGWLKGQFYLDYPNGLRAVAPWTGYAMLFFCGLHWGGIAGAFMAWCAPQRPLGGRGWCARIAAGILGALVAAVVVRVVPQLFLPFYGEGLYDVAGNKTCIRALDSIRTIAPHVGAFLGFLCFEAFRRDRRAVAMMLVMALGFAIPFTVGGYWQTFNGSQLHLPWWKNWEMSIGLGGGLAFGLAFYLFNRPQTSAAPRSITRKERIWGVGLPVWAGCGPVLGGGYDGYRRLHEFDWPMWVRIVLTVLYLVVATFLFTKWASQTRKLSDAALSEASAVLISSQTLVSILILIWAAGLITSVPPVIHLENAYLLTLYTVYLLLSLASLYVLRTRRARVLG